MTEHKPGSADSDAGLIDPELVVTLAAELDGHVDEDTVNALTDALARAGMTLVLTRPTTPGGPTDD